MCQVVLVLVSKVNSQPFMKSNADRQHTTITLSSNCAIDKSHSIDGRMKDTTIESSIPPRWALGLTIQTTYNTS